MNTAAAHYRAVQRTAANDVIAQLVAEATPPDLR